MNFRIDKSTRDYVRKRVKQRFYDDDVGLPLFFAIAGSHPQGVASPTSDIDLRGFHCVDGTQYLLLSNPEPQIRFTITPPKDMPEIEVVSHELRTFGSRLLKFHFNAIEPLFANDTVIHHNFTQLSVIRADIIDALPGELPARYSGMAQSLYDDYVTADAPQHDELTVKKLLYTLRGALAAQYVQDQNAIEPDLTCLSKTLLSEADQIMVQRLIGVKQTTTIDSVSDKDIRRVREIVQNLLSNTHSTSFSKSKRQTFQAAIEEWMLSVREKTDTRSKSF